MTGQNNSLAQRINARMAGCKSLPSCALFRRETTPGNRKLRENTANRLLPDRSRLNRSGPAANILAEAVAGRRLRGLGAALRRRDDFHSGRTIAGTPPAVNSESAGIRRDSAATPPQVIQHPPIRRSAAPRPLSPLRAVPPAPRRRAAARPPLSVRVHLSGSAAVSRRPAGTPPATLARRVPACAPSARWHGSC